MPQQAPSIVDGSLAVCAVTCLGVTFKDQRVLRVGGAVLAEWRDRYERRP